MIFSSFLQLQKQRYRRIAAASAPDRTEIHVRQFRQRTVRQPRMVACLMILIKSRYTGSEFYRRHLCLQIRHSQKPGRKARLLTALTHQIRDDIGLLQLDLHKGLF